MTISGDYPAVKGRCGALETIDAQVVVVGAGPTGGAVAWRLAQAGLDVVCLERGHWPDYAALDRDGADWELRRAGPLHTNPNRRRGPDDDPVDDLDSPIKSAVASGVGGASLHWAAHVPRYRPEDFRVRTLDGVADDWPIAYADLEPYYAINEAMIGAAYLPGDPSAPPRSGRPLPLPTLGPHGRRVAAALDRLGWHWWPVDLAVGPGAATPEARPCDHLGPCDLGCPSRIRAGADRTYLEPAVALGARVVTGLRVGRLEHDNAGRVTAALCRGSEGAVRVTGRTFVLCANGMETPRLLLLSASERFPDGLANGSGQVGRNLMLHPHARVDGSFAEAVGAWTAGEKAGLVCLEFYASAGRYDFPRGFKLQLNPGPGPVALARGAPGGTALPWGSGHHAAFEAAFDRTLGLTVCVEDLPEPGNAVKLSERLTDRDGLPAPRLAYTLSDASRRCLDFGVARAREILETAGARRCHVDPLRVEAGFHLMGTARMGDDARTSVVDSWGRCHDLENLYVGDASVFVTSGCLNPTSTAQAFALRLADRIATTVGRS